MNVPRHVALRIAWTLFVQAVAAIAVIEGCSSSTDPRDLPEVLVPLKVGNVWIERVTTYDTNGAIRSVRPETTVVRATKLLEGETWYQTHDPVWVANRVGGYWVSIDGMGAWLAAKYPATVGDTFGTARVSVLMDSGTTFRHYLKYVTVAATDRRMSTEAGTFSCYEYRFTLTELDGSTIQDHLFFYDDRFFVAPGVGYVRNEQYSKLVSGRVFLGGTRELVNFTVAR